MIKIHHTLQQKLNAIFVTGELPGLQVTVKDERRRNIWCTNMELEK